MSERRGYAPEREQSPELRQELSRRLDVIANRSRNIGVELTYLVADKNLRPIAACNADKPVFAANIGSLPLALMTLDYYDYRPDIDDNLDEMLACSNTDSYARLAEALGGPKSIQSFYNNWRHTSVNMAPNGRTEIGDTTPAEALLQLRLLLGEQSKVDAKLDTTIKNALFSSEVDNHGIRRVVTADHPGVSIWNKSGEYNGDPDTPYAVRHDVGALNTFRGDDFLFYAFMTKSQPGKAGGWLGDQVVSLAAAEALVAMGHYDYCKMGAKAMRFVGVRSPQSSFGLAA